MTSIDPKKIVPTGTRVLVKFLEPKNGIILPESLTTVDIPGQIIALAVGPDVTFCEPGQNLMLRPEPNLFVVNGPEKLGIIDQSAILAILG